MQVEEDKPLVKQRSKKSREAPMSIQDELKHQFPKEGCKLQVTREDSLKDASQQKEKIEQLSQSVQLYTARVKTAEIVLQQEEQKVQELLETCNRQQQNICKLQSSIEHTNLKYCDEVKSREAANAKYVETTQMIHALHSACNTVTNSLQRVCEGKNTFQLRIEELNNESKQMQSSLDEMITSLPTIEDLKRILCQEEQNTKDLEIETQRKLDATRERNVIRKESSMTTLSGLEEMIRDLGMQILSKENEVENERKLGDAEYTEFNQQIQCLKGQIGDLTEKISFTEKEFLQTQDEVEAATIEVKKMESVLSVNKLSEENLATDLAQLLKSEEELKKSLLERESEVQNLERELDAERNQNRDLNTEVEETKAQLQELKKAISNQVEVLSMEYKKVVAISNEREPLLQNYLDDLRDQLTAVTKKEEDLMEESFQVEHEMQCLSEIHSQALQSKNTLESDLAACGILMQELIKEKKETEEYLAMKRADVEQTEQILLQSQANNEKSVCEIRSQIAYLKKEENVAIEELDILRLTEQDYQSKIEAIKSKTANLCAQMNKQHMQHTAELQESIICAETELESLASESEKRLSEFNENLRSLGELEDKKKKIIFNLNDTIQKQKAESERNVNRLNILAEEKEERTKRVNEINEKVSQLMKEIKIRHKQQQENSSAVEENEIKLKEVNSLIAELEINYNTLQSEYSKFVTVNESDRQVYLKGLQDFQNTSNLRLDEVKALQKQINVWNDKVNQEKVNQEKGDSECRNLKEKAESSKMEMTEIEKLVQEWKANISASEAEDSKAEADAENIKRNLEQLKNKIAAHRASKRDERRAMVQEPVFKVPTPVCSSQRIVTPQFSATVTSDKEDNELTPRSILKTSSRPLTPQQRKMTPPQRRNVTFADFDEGSSSSSSVMLEPEMIDRIAANPAYKRVLEAQHRDRQNAKKKLKTEHVIEFATPAMKINDDNEISSSTPEHNEVQEQDVFDFI